MYEHIEIKRSSPRQFGIVFSCIFALVAFYPLFWGGEMRLWALGLASLFAAVSSARPQLLDFANRGWFALGLFLGRIIAPLVMALIYLLVMFPIGLMLRLAGKDMLRLKKHEGQSYWIERVTPPQDMRRQF